MNTLPPRRDLPDNVRERLRTRVMGDQPGKSRSRGLLATAAAVVLVAGALALSTSIERTQPTATDPTTTQADPTLPFSPPTMEEELDRCWAALVDAGKTDGYPDRSEWRGVVKDFGGGNVTAAWAGETPIICATTPSQVTVSSPTATPEYLGDSRTGVLMRTESGVVAGVLDPTWSNVEVEYLYPDGAFNGGAAHQADGLFVFSSLENLRDPRLDLRIRRLEPGQSVPVNPLDGTPAGLGPAPVTVFDRLGAPDEYGQTGMTACLKDADVPDVESWEPGADWMGRVGGRIIGGGGLLARNGDQMYVCDPFQTPNAFIDLGTHPLPAANDAPIRLAADLDFPTVLGLVSADAAYVDVYFGTFSLRTAVVNSTFAVEDAGTVTKVEVFDRNHALLYTGPFS